MHGERDLPLRESRQRPPDPANWTVSGDQLRDITSAGAVLTVVCEGRIYVSKEGSSRSHSARISREPTALVPQAGRGAMSRLEPC